jgi:hypothetical protein
MKPKGPRPRPLYGFCGVHRIEACPEPHDAPMRPCAVCEMDYPEGAGRFKRAGRNICRLCQNARDAARSAARYRTDQEYRERRLLAAKAQNGRRGPRLGQKPGKPKPREIVVVGLCESRPVSRGPRFHFAHVVVRERDGAMVVACGAVKPLVVEMASDLKLCRRCAPRVAGKPVAPSTDSWRPSLPIVELEATA